MKKSNVIEIERQGESARDVLTGLLKRGAQDLLSKALENEVSEYLEYYDNLKLSSGNQRLVRNGHLPSRNIISGIGELAVDVPRVRDLGETGRKMKFSSAIIPPYLKKTKSMEELLPCLYLKGISSGDFSEALAAILGKDVKGLSANNILRLKEVWQKDYSDWNKRDLSDKRYIYVWADGVYFNVRMDESRHCVLVLIGATESGEKEFLAIIDGYRESEESWTQILLDLKHRGLKYSPNLAMGDGSLGFWKALRKIYGSTREQRCWMHKTGNVLNALPKSEQGRAKTMLHDIWLASTKKEAEKAFELFVSSYKLKHEKAALCLEKDRDSLLAFYDFPAEHWVHLRTTNPIESAFSVVRLRMYKTKGCLSRTSMLSMVFKLGMSAQKRWRKLKGAEKLVSIVKGVQFIDGLEMAA